MWNNLFFLNEADDEDEKKKNDEKEDKEEKDKPKDKDKKEETNDDDYNDLDLSDDDTDSDDNESSDADIDDDYNDLDIDDEKDSDDSIGDIDTTDDDDSGDYNALVVAVGSNDNSEDGSVYEKAAKAAYAYIVIANNMKHIHLNVCGRKFNEIHSMCDVYYSHFSSLADFFYELAAESPLITLDNPTRAKEHCEDIEVEMEKEYDFRTALERITENMERAMKYISDLRSVSDIRTDVQSKVDDELGYLNKETRYFIRKRLTDPSTPDTVEMEAYNYNDLF